MDSFNPLQQVIATNKEFSTIKRKEESKRKIKKQGKEEMMKRDRKKSNMVLNLLRYYNRDK